MNFLLRERERRHYVALLIIPLILCAYWLYSPGLSGPFILDDFPNLETISHMGGVHSSTDLWRFLTSGFSGPTGRPISLLSFILNDPNGPTDPEPYKYTNILLHLLNGVLIVWLSFRLSGIAGLARQPAAWVGLAVGALWTLHPLNVSTVLYVIQRMTELMALFILAGTIAYVHGRQTVAHSPSHGYLWMTVAIVVFMPLATLSKENGALLPLYCLVIEYTLLRSQNPTSPHHWRAWSGIFLFLPLAIIASYFLYRIAHGLQGYAIRDFNMGERLITEPRILWDYLLHITIPNLAGSGLFHDDYSPSRSLFNPWQTFPAVAGIITLIVGVFYLRRRAPVIAFAFGWFLAGHVIESTFLPLELYFEHRNYLPMLGPLFALGYYALQAGGKLYWPSRVSLILLIILCGGLTLQQSKLWGDISLMSNVWAVENPRSLRAQQLAANYWSTKGQYETAKRHLQEALEYNPKETALSLQILQLDCLEGKVTRESIKKIIDALPSSANNNASETVIKTLISYHKDGTCSELTLADIHNMLSALISNPKYRAMPQSLRNLYYLQGQLYGEEFRLNPAMEALDHAYALEPDADIALQQAVWLTTAGLYDDALRYVDKARMADNDKWWHAGLRSKDIDNMQQAIISLKSKKAGNANN